MSFEDDARRVLRGDPVSALHEADPEEVVGLLASLEGARYPSFQVRTDAAAAVVSGAVAEGDIIMVLNRRFEVNALGPDGLIAIDMNFGGGAKRIVSKMKTGSAVEVACFGDSTTDGNTTTGHTANPTNDDNSAVGGSAHTPAFAWPAQLQTIFRNMFKNSGINVHNAGYGGRSILGGWARENYQVAVIDTYGNPDLVFINFGINDMTRATFDVDDLATELRYVLDLVDFHGGVPVLVTPDPIALRTRASPAEVFNGSKTERVTQVLMAAAEEHNTICLNTHDRLLASWNLMKTNFRWDDGQPDGVHQGDRMHELKAGLIAALLNPKALFLNEGQDVVKLPPYSKHLNSDILLDTYNLNDSVNTASGQSMNVPADSYTLGQDLLQLWVWVDSAEFFAYFRAVDGCGYYERPLADAPEIEVYNYRVGVAETIKVATAGFAQGEPDRRAAETPTFIGQLSAGLTRITLKAPTDAVNAAVFLSGFVVMRAAEEKTVAQRIPGTGTGLAFFDTDQRSNSRIVPCFGAGRTLEADVELSLPDGAGVLLWSEAVFSGTADSDSNSKWGVALYRNGSDAELYRVTFENDGSGQLVGSAIASATLAGSWTSRTEFRVTGEVNGSEDQIIQVYEGWDSVSPLLTSTVASGAETLSFGGQPGAFFKDYGVSGGGLARLHFETLTIT